MAAIPSLPSSSHIWLLPFSRPWLLAVFTFIQPYLAASIQPSLAACLAAILGCQRCSRTWLHPSCHLEEPLLIESNDLQPFDIVLRLAIVHRHLRFHPAITSVIIQGSNRDVHQSSCIHRSVTTTRINRFHFICHIINFLSILHQQDNTSQFLQLYHAS